MNSTHAWPGSARELLEAYILAESQQTNDLNVELAALGVADPSSEHLQMLAAGIPEWWYEPDAGDPVGYQPSEDTLWADAAYRSFYTRHQMITRGDSLLSREVDWDLEWIERLPVAAKTAEPWTVRVYSGEGCFYLVDDTNATTGYLIVPRAGRTGGAA